MAQAKGGPTTGQQGPQGMTDCATEIGCMHCGRPIPLGRQSLRFCSITCKNKAWRAVKMLEGTHRWSGSRFARIDAAYRNYVRGLA